MTLELTVLYQEFGVRTVLLGKCAKINLAKDQIEMIYRNFSEILGPVFGGFLTEHYGFQKASTSMGVCAIVMVNGKLT